jgi:hypothetical protein
LGGYGFQNSKSTKKNWIPDPDKTIPKVSYFSAFVPFLSLKYRERETQGHG